MQFNKIEIKVTQFNYLSNLYRNAVLFSLRALKALIKISVLVITTINSSKDRYLIANILHVILQIVTKNTQPLKKQTIRSKISERSSLKVVRLKFPDIFRRKRWKRKVRKDKKPRVSSRSSKNGS